MVRRRSTTCRCVNHCVSTIQALVVSRSRCSGVASIQPAATIESKIARERTPHALREVAIAFLEARHVAQQRVHVAVEEAEFPQVRRIRRRGSASTVSKLCAVPSRGARMASSCASMRSYRQSTISSLLREVVIEVARADPQAGRDVACRDRVRAVRIEQGQRRVEDAVAGVGSLGGGALLAGHSIVSGRAGRWFCSAKYTPAGMPFDTGRRLRQSMFRTFVLNIQPVPGGTPWSSTRGSWPFTCSPLATLAGILLGGAWMWLGFVVIYGVMIRGRRVPRRLLRGARLPPSAAAELAALSRAAGPVRALRRDGVDGGIGRPARPRRLGAGRIWHRPVRAPRGHRSLALARRRSSRRASPSPRSAPTSGTN